MANLSDIKPGAVFTHYKNKDYEIITLAKDEATEEQVVVYKLLYGDFSVWTRRLKSFCEDVEVGGQTVERFRLKSSLRGTE